MVAHDRVGTLAAKKRCYGAGVGAYLQLELVALAGRTEFGVEQNPPVNIMSKLCRASGTDALRKNSKTYQDILSRCLWTLHNRVSLRLQPCRRLGNGRIEKRQTLMGL